MGKKKFKHGRYLLCHSKDKNRFLIYDTRLDRGRSFNGEKVVQFSKKTHLKTVLHIIKKGESLIRPSGANILGKGE